MNTPAKWNPFRDLDELGHRLAGLAPRSAGLPERGGREAMTVAEWAPAVDITEDEKEFLIKAELPEVKKEDVRVTVEDGVVTLRGERRFEKEEKSRRYHRVERSYGSFVRSFSLPDEVNPDKVSADFKDGVLAVHLPKEARPAPKAVDVKFG